MLPEQKILLRNVILQLLARGPMSGLTVQRLHVGCTLERFHLSPDQFDAEVEVLLGKKLIRKEADAVNDAVAYFHLTDTGRAHLKQAGLD